MSDDRDRAVHDQRLHFGERATEHAGDVRLLVALGELDRFGEVVFLEELRELGRELDRFPSAPCAGSTTSRSTTESDQIDMKSEDCPRGTFRRTASSPRSSARSRFITQLLHGCGEMGDYLTIANGNGCCTSCFTFLPPTSAGMNRMRGSAFFTAVREELVRGT